MSKKAKRRASAMSFSLSRWFSRISTAKPSSFVLSVIIIAYAIFLLSGGLYTIINQPLSYAYLGNNFFFVLSSSIVGRSTLGEQFGAETAISAVVFAFGFIGLLTTYQSTKYAYRPRQAHMMMVIGVSLLLLAYILVELILSAKI